MSEITVYDRADNKVLLEPIGHGLYERVVRHEGGTVEHTGRIVNLDVSLQCDALFTEERHERFIQKQKNCGRRKETCAAT